MNNEDTVRLVSPPTNVSNEERNQRYAWYMRATILSCLTAPTALAVGIIMGKSDLSVFEDTAVTFDTQFTPMSWIRYMWYIVWFTELIWVGFMYVERERIGVHEFAASIGTLTIFVHGSQALFVYGWVYEITGMAFAFAIIHLFVAYLRSSNTTALTVRHKWMYRWTRIPKLVSSWSVVLFTMSLIAFLVDDGKITFYSMTKPALVIYIPVFLSLFVIAVPIPCCDDNNKSGLGRDAVGAFVVAIHTLAIATHTRDGESASVTTLKSFGAALSILVLLLTLVSRWKWESV